MRPEAFFGSLSPLPSQVFADGGEDHVRKALEGMLEDSPCASLVSTLRVPRAASAVPAVNPGLYG